MKGYLVIDPGQTTGYAYFDPKGKAQGNFQIEGIEEFGAYLELALAGEYTTWIAVVYETYKVFPNVRQGGSEVPAAQVIGIIKHLCRKYHVRLESVDPKYKKIGYAWSGKRPPSNHAVSHGPDAEALGEYWLRKNKIKGIDD